MHKENPLMTAKFRSGRLLATPGALEVLEANAVLPQELLCRHLSGDWGCVCPEDGQANESALQRGQRLLSCYIVGASKVWVITEGDRSATTILLPSEY